MRNRANSIAHGGGLCLLRPTLFSCLPYKSAHLEKEPLYLEDIGTKAANKSVYDWQLKENTDDRINDWVKYCNAVFVRAGKAAQERLKQEVQAALG